MSILLLSCRLCIFAPPLHDLFNDPLISLRRKNETFVLHSLLRTSTRRSKTKYSGQDKGFFFPRFHKTIEEIKIVPGLFCSHLGILRRPPTEEQSPVTKTNLAPGMADEQSSATKINVAPGMCMGFSPSLTLLVPLHTIKPPGRERWF